MFIEQIFNPNHRLCNVHIAVRVMYMLPAFLLVICSNSLTFNIVTALIFLSLMRIIAKISFKQIIRLLMVPLLFIIIGCITIGIELNYPLMVSYSSSSIQHSLIIFSRSWALISIVYLGILTHTISEMAQILKWVKLPMLFIELFVLLYRFGMRLRQISHQLFIAQKCRLGYGKAATNYQHLGMLFAQTLQISIRSNKSTEIAMETRMANHHYQFVARQIEFKRNSCVAPLLLFGVLLIAFGYFNF